MRRRRGTADGTGGGAAQLGRSLGSRSVATSLAIFWGTELDERPLAVRARRPKVPTEEWVATRVPADTLLSALSAASDPLTSDFGSWQTPWGQINRFQRVNDDIVSHFSDKLIPAFRCRLRIPDGARWPHFRLGSIRVRRSGTAQTATALLRWLSLGQRCERGQLLAAARAAIRNRATSTTKPNATCTGICARSSTTLISSQGTRSGRIILANRPHPGRRQSRLTQPSPPTIA